ncbi:MAG: hypothetical protein EOM24_36755 [Chloroflexia bacterium]|nr:hypothetical protein [Chloroflexia bacterium]
MQHAIERTCEDATDVAPLVILMLGGDDLLVVCRAEKAMPFVVALCEELANMQGNPTDAFELTLGIGVVMAKPNIPIYRLHEVAAQLASSAKRRFRGLKARGVIAPSVVDWAVYTSAWVDDPEDVRRRDWMSGTVQDRRVLSQRPLDVLGDGLDSLQGLLRGAETLKDAPRSQLRFLVEQLPRGKVLAELAFAELSKEAHDKLQAAGVPSRSVWQRCPDGGPWMTPLLDLIEINEIAHLGSSTKTSQREQEVIDG